MAPVARLSPKVQALIGPVPRTVSFGRGAKPSMGGPYEGAARLDRDLASWAPPVRSADSDLLASKPLMDSRARDLIRNDAYAQSGQTLHKDSVVGDLFIPNLKPEFKTLGLDEKWATEYQEEVETKFMLAAESPNKWLDASAMKTLTGMVRLAIGMSVYGGEVLASVEWMRETPRPFQTAVQMIELDRLSTPPTIPRNSNVRGGIRRNKNGRPIEYFIRNALPGSPWEADVATWTTVPAKLPRIGRLQMIHVLDQQRPDQTRGISALATGLKELRITKKYRDTVLESAVAQATYAATIESELPAEAVYAQLGGGAGFGEGAIGYAEDYMAAVADYLGGSKNIALDGVKIPHLYPGTSLKLNNPGNPGGIGQNFEQSLLRYLAAALDLSYEELSRDFSQSNYSSIRAGLALTERSSRAKKRMIADPFANAIFRLWLEEQLNTKGAITSMPRNPPSWYEGLNFDAYSRCEWIGARRDEIDELKETQASVLKLKYRLTTYEEEWAKRGKDWRGRFSQMEREQKALIKADIAPVDSNAINAASGAPRDKSDGGQRDTSDSETQTE